MSCGRCIDIHNAQKKGLSGKSCECSCHSIPVEIYSGPTTPTWYEHGVRYDIQTVVSTQDEAGTHTINLN